jgi:hypothetical protein
VAVVDAAKLRAAIGQHAIDPNIARVEERHDPIVEQIGRRRRALAIIELSRAPTRSRPRGVGAKPTFEYVSIAVC